MYTILLTRVYADPEINKCFGFENKYFGLEETYGDALEEVKRRNKMPYTMKDDRFVFEYDQKLHGPARDEYQIIEEEIDLPF